MNRRNFFKKIICLFKGHVGLKRDAECVSHYIRIPVGRGAFCQDPERYEYDGRLYRCARCGELLLFHGVAQWELKDLIEATLKDIPASVFDIAYSNQNYEIMRIYR